MATDSKNPGDGYARANETKATEMEVVINAHKSKARKALVAKVKARNSVKINLQQLVTLKIPIKLRMNPEQMRLLCRSIAGERTNNNTLKNIN